MERKNFKLFSFLTLIVVVCINVFILSGCGTNKHLTKGHELYREKNIQGAIDETKTAVKEEPKNIDALNFLLKLYSENKNYAEAVEICQKILTLYPKDIKVHFNLAKAYKENSEFDKAAEELKIVIDLNPNGKLAGEAQKLISECETAKTQAPKNTANENDKKNAGADNNTLNKTGKNGINNNKEINKISDTGNKNGAGSKDNKAPKSYSY